MTHHTDGRRFVRALAIACMAMLLSACPQQVRSPAPQKPVAAPPVTTDLHGASVYEVSPTASSVHILVYRGGTLARLGHNHVMTVQALHGRIWLHPAFAKSGFDLGFPVAQLVVDDASARAAAGEDFPGEIRQADRDGTRRNMLREEVLDAEHHPDITLRSVRVAGTPQQPQLTVRITIRDASRDVNLTPVLQREGTRLTVSGEFDIQQSDFGIKPFSAALGALEVQDRVHIRFSVVGERQDPP